MLGDQIEAIVRKYEMILVRLLRSNILPEQSYLAGGTAVYFYLRHRLSVDLDFFTESRFTADLFLSKMRTCFDEVAVESMEQDTLILFVSPEKIKFSLFHYPYPLLSPPVAMPIGEGLTCPLASLRDIAAMKAVAINQRGSIKDFIDLFYILRETKLDFGGVSRLAIEKYRLAPHYDYHLRTSFVYFDDAERELEQIVMLEGGKEKRLFTAKEWEDIKSFYKELVR
ncbi:MAG: nucleotidyl transferase AbiEii/AbiGii toxin family protein [Deltaproteobacteria bacterium]|nr:nucleotidyl transferase AbiEii/AbiGii toxin family protein [Deltaproteobacteria bacterium]